MELCHSDIIKEKALLLYPEFHTVYGPYYRKEDNRSILIFYDGVRRSAKQYAKIKLEIKLGRKLTKNEEVDHIDGNVQNDRFSNLQALSSFANKSKAAKKYTEKDFIGKCPHCSKVFIKKDIRITFCSKRCSSSFYASKKNGMFGINENCADGVTVAA